MVQNDRLAKIQLEPDANALCRESCLAAIDLSHDAAISVENEISPRMLHGHMIHYSHGLR